MRKAFDIEKAKAGAKVVTRDGRPARIVAFDRKGEYPVCALVDEQTFEYANFYLESGLMHIDKEHVSDLLIEVEPTYRPYSNAAEMDEAIKKHGTFVKDSYGVRSAIKGYDDSNAAVGTGCTYGALLECYKWLDGTPCGVQEGGDNE